MMKFSKEQQSVIAIASGLLLFAWLKHSDWPLIFAGIAILALPFPWLNKPIHTAWMMLSKILGWISSHIILTILFYFFLTPLSLLRKLTGKRDMMRHLPDEATSVFHQRDHRYNVDDFRNPW